MKGHKSNTPENEKDCAQTPGYIVSGMESILGRPFELDVFALPQTAKVANYYSLENGDDGLKLPWCNLNFCNPPFSDIMPWIEKAVSEAKDFGRTTAMIMPNNPEVAYCRASKKHADTIIEMPYRVQYYRPNGEPFLDSKGRKSTPQFSSMIAVFTPLGIIAGSARHICVDFREYMK